MSTPEQVLLLPGLLCDDWVWREQADALADVADVVIADLSAFDDLGAMAAASLRLVDDDDRPVHVVGHSMGGRVALEIWRQAPQRVRSLVLMDTGVHGVEPGEVESRQVLLDLVVADGRAWVSSFSEDTVYAVPLDD